MECFICKEKEATTKIGSGKVYADVCQDCFKKADYSLKKGFFSIYRMQSAKELLKKYF